MRIPLPVGYVWGEAPGEVRLDPDEEVVLALRNVFAHFAELGAARRICLVVRSAWQVFLPGHHEGYVNWQTYEANLERVQANRR